MYAVLTRHAHAISNIYDLLNGMCNSYRN